MSLHRLWRWARTETTPAWDPSSTPREGPLSFHSELRTAAQLMDVSRDQSQPESGDPVIETGTAA